MKLHIMKQTILVLLTAFALRGMRRTAI